MNPNPAERYFQLQDALRQVTEVAEGEVTYLKAQGWTDSQARAIVASMMGWKSPNPPSDGADA